MLSILQSSQHRFTVEPFLELFAQVSAEVGVGDSDKGFSPLAESMAFQMGYTVLGDDIVHVIP